ncbi:hypothetical protein ACQP3J_33435 [Escherichia coli]
MKIDAMHDLNNLMGLGARLLAQALIKPWTGNGLEKHVIGGNGLVDVMFEVFEKYGRKWL